MKKVLFLLVIVFLFSTAKVGVAGENLLKNGSFEDTNGGLPDFWSTGIYGDDVTGVRFSVENRGAYGGSNYVTIENIRPNDAKLLQTVKVKPETVYRLSCRIKAEGIGENALGANIAVLHILGTSTDFKDTGGKWEYVELYGRTGKKQDSVIVTARLGGYGNVNTGRASFDDFRMTQVAAPSGAKIINLSGEDSEGQKAEAEPTGYQSVIIIASVCFLGLFLALYNGLLKQNKVEGTEQERTNYLFYFFVLIALIIRIVLAPVIEGHPTDILSFKTWANVAASQGLLNFYKTDIFVDYPPGYIYVLYICGYIKNLFSLGFDSAAFVILIKLPAILCDIVFSILVFRLGKKTLGTAAAAALGILYVFNPAVLFNSTIYGQMDSILTLLIIAAMLLLFKDRFVIASIVFMMAILVKPQALIFTPIGIYALIEKTIQSKSLKTAVLCALSMLLTFIVIILPFTIRQDVFWIFDLYGKTLASYPYGSVNAFSLFAFLGANGVSENNILFLFSYKIWGYIFAAVTVAMSAFFYFTSRHKSRAFYVAMLIMAAFFVLSSRMHERYIFPALGLAVLNYIYTRDRRFLFLFLGFSLTAFLNQALLMDMILTKNIFWFPSNSLTMKALSFVNIGLLIYLLKTGVDIHIKNKIQLISSIEAKQGEIGDKTQNLSTFTESRKIRLSKKDYLLMGSLTLVYAVMALTNLGSFKAPQSFWKPANKSESFYADIGTLQEIERVYYFLGFGEGAYKVDFSEDGQTWRYEKTIEQKSRYGMVQWRYFKSGNSARYVRITTESPGVMLNEIGFFGPGSTEPILIKSIVKPGSDSVSSGKPENVFDEQNTIAYTPGFFNGMYFDEVYHARTAYETLHKMEPSETTHPPLGKTLISVGIAAFGATPFGWRIMGTLFGMAMVPLMYLFGMRIFKRTELAFIAVFLFIFDFMFFSMSRIGTIDVFAVFFIVLMFYYMSRYFEMNFFEAGLKKTLLPLLLCGIFFGLGLATKWITLYGGLGIAVVFFTSLCLRFSEYRKALKKLKGKGRVRKKDRQKSEAIVRLFPGRAVSTLLWCVLFFVFIPAVIYLMSYIPFMMLDGPGHEMSDVVTYQKHIYDYHSALEATHPFSSNWWEWPMIRKPVWCYSGTDVAAGKISSIVIMGNPAVWWVGSLATIATVVIALSKKDKRMYVVLVAAASLYLPWALAARKLLFVYHFFAVTPFLVLCVAYLCMVIKDKFTKFKYIIYAYLVSVVILFVMFYPLLSGMVVNKSYAASYLRWFDSWIFFQ